MNNGRPMGAVEFVGVMKGLIPKCDEFGEFNRGLAIVKRNGKYGVVNIGPRLIIPIEYDTVQILEHHILVKKEQEYFLRDMYGRPLLHPVFVDVEAAIDYASKH